MNVYTLFVAGLVGTVCFSTGLSAQQIGAPSAPAPGALPGVTQDVAQLAYQLRNQLYKQQGIIESRNADVMEYHQAYVDDPTAANMQNLVNALKKDTDAVNQYSTLLKSAQVQSLERKIDTAESTYYKETPVTETEMKSGPSGKGVPKGGESLESELPLLDNKIPTPPPALVETLKQEIKANPGGKGVPSFAEQLQKQMTQLQSMKTRIENEQKDSAVTSNPTAKKEDNDLRSILEKAIMARRQALGE